MNNVWNREKNCDENYDGGEGGAHGDLVYSGIDIPGHKNFNSLILSSSPHCS